MIAKRLCMQFCKAFRYNFAVLECGGLVHVNSDVYVTVHSKFSLKSKFVSLPIFNIIAAMIR